MHCLSKDCYHRFFATDSCSHSFSAPLMLLLPIKNPSISLLSPHLFHTLRSLLSLQRREYDFIVLEGSVIMGFLPVCFSSLWIQQKRKVIRIQRQAQLPEKSTKRITTRFWEWKGTQLPKSFENRTSDWRSSTILIEAAMPRSYPFF